MGETATEVARYVIEVWGADIGPGELCAVVADALTAHETEHERVRVSYTNAALAPVVPTQPSTEGVDRG